MGKRYPWAPQYLNVDLKSSTVALDGTLCLVDQDKLRPIIVDDLSKYQVNSNDISSIEPYEEPKLVVLETNVSLDQTGQNDQYDHSAQTDGILNDDQPEHSNHNSDEPIIKKLPNTKDVQTSKPLSSLAEDALVLNINPILTNPSLSISSMASPAPQDKCATSAHECLFVDFLSEKDPKKVYEALKHPGWVDAMQEELNQFSRNKVWILTRHVSQGYNEQEGIVYDETFAPVARLEAIRIFLAFATYINFMVYQMDVKSAFLNEKLKEKVYVKQPPGFESSEFTNHIKQSVRGILINQEKYVIDLLKKNDNNGSLVKTPMVPPNNLGRDLNGKAINKTQCIGMIRSLMYLTASRPYIQFSTCLCARYQENPKESHLIVVMRIFRKSTSAEVEYVAAAACCANILWMKSHLTKYDIIYEKDQPELIIPLDLAPQAEFNLDDISLKPNNKVALLYLNHLNNKVFLYISDFSSKCYLREAFTRTLTQYKEYLYEFWYTAKVLKETNRVWFFTPTGGIKGEVGLTSFRNAIRANYLAHSKQYVEPPSMEIIREWFSLIGYSGEIEAKAHMLAICNVKEPVAFEAPNTSVYNRKKVEVARLYKEAQQATGGPTSLGVTREEGANPQLSSGMQVSIHTKPIYSASTITHSESALEHDISVSSKARVDSGLSTPKDSVSQTIGKGASNIAKEIKDEFNTSPGLSSSDDAQKDIKLEDLSKLIQNVGVDFIDLDSPKDDQPIIVEDDEEEDVAAKDDAKKV
ncbi:retrovirus-related pol polyprotein from transposon TNT 1-94 [Tanacetum coccineum]